MHPSPSTTNQVIDRNESGGIIGKKRSKMTAKGANKNFYTHIFGAMRCREMFFTIFAIKSRNSRPDNIKTDTIDMTINETQDEIIDEFEGLTDWMDRYAYIIDLGNTLEELPEKRRLLKTS